ncbi:MAG: hypothetical protein WC710_15030 [Gallionella sp.]|jgi:hypothetical protein
MSDIKLPEIFEAVKILQLQPDDVVVFRCDMFLSMDQRERIMGLLKNQFTDNKILILDGGADIDILREEKHG